MTDRSDHEPGRARGRGDRTMPRPEETLRKQDGGTFHSRMSAGQRYTRGSPYPPGPPQHQKPSRESSSTAYPPGPPQHQKPSQGSSLTAYPPGPPRHQKPSQGSSSTAYPPGPPRHQKPSQGSSSTAYPPGPPRHQKPFQGSSSTAYPPGPPQHQKLSQEPSLPQHTPFQETKMPPPPLKTFYPKKVEDEPCFEEKQEKMRKAFSSLQLFSRGKSGVLAALSSEPTSRISGDKKKGRMGAVIPVQTNLFRFETSKKDAFHHYNVRFDPEVGSSRFGRRLIRQVESQAGISNNYVTDGSSLFCTQLLNEERVKELKASTSTTAYKVTLTHVGSIHAGSQMVMQLLNIIFNSILQDYFDLKWMGGNYYDIKHPCQIQGTSYSLYSGFFSSILEYENGARLMMDVSHKLVSTETVLEMIQKRDPRSIRAHVGGKIVHTRYNDRTYKVEDIDFDKNPHFTFTFRNKEISVAEYYKMKYNIEIRNFDQPLLSVRPKKRELRAGSPEIIYLVPELCHITGFTDEVRSNNNIMRRFSQQTKLEPHQRLQKMNNFVRQIAGNPEVRKVLDSFNITLNSDTIQTEARKLPRLAIIPRDLQAITRSNLFKPANLLSWKIIYPAGMDHEVNDFLQDLNRFSREMGMTCERPQLLPYRNDGEMQDLAVAAQPERTDMVLAVIRPDLRKYSALKKILCIQRPIPSQVVLCHNVINRKPPVLCKIALQLCCKMGGAAWSINNMNLAKTMIIGVDTYHDSQRRNCSYAGVVASLDVHCSKYYTTWHKHTVGREILTSFGSILIECMKEFHIANNFPCEKIIIYRDGVGDGQLDMLMKSELNEALDAIRRMNIGDPKLAYIVVKKRINARFFTREGNTYRNPPPGTVIDNEATRPTWMDFYLVNHEVRGGSVTPTHFNIIHNNTNLRMDELQLLTYQQCHLYFNWTGAIRVPAVCQYAHKVAYLIGQCLHEQPHPALQRKLFFL